MTEAQESRNRDMQTDRKTRSGTEEQRQEHREGDENRWTGTEKKIRDIWTEGMDRGKEPDRDKERDKYSDRCRETDEQR